MAKTAVSRLEDVDPNSVLLDTDRGLLKMRPRPGRTLDPVKIFEAIRSSRFHSRLDYVEVTVAGPRVKEENGKWLLTLPGSDERFLLEPSPQGNHARAPDTPSPFEALCAAVRGGERIRTVTGRLRGLSLAPRGRGAPAPPPLRLERPLTLLVTAFEREE